MSNKMSFKEWSEWILSIPFPEPVDMKAAYQHYLNSPAIFEPDQQPSKPQEKEDGVREEDNAMDSLRYLLNKSSENPKMQVGTILDKRFNINMVTVREHLEQIWASRSITPPHTSAGGEEIPQTPNKDKPFIVANVRELADKYESEEISFSRMVEIMNEMVFKWQQSLPPQSATEPQDDKGWIRVEDGLPEPDRDYLVYIVGYGKEPEIVKATLVWAHGYWLHIGGYGTIDDYVTHWMPLPTPPQE